MESAYGIGVHNRFNLYAEDEDVEDPFDILRKREEELGKLKTEKLTRDKTKQSSKHALVGGPKPKKDASAKGNIPTKMQEKPVKAPGKLPKVGAVSDKNVKNTENSLMPDGGWKDEPRRGRGGFAGGRGMSRGRNNANGFDQRGKREFDRQSGSNKSGVKPVEKRDGGGAHNWGTMINDSQIQEGRGQDGREMGNEDGQLAPLDPDDGSEKPSPNKAKPEDESEMTYDEWKQKEQGKRSIPSYNLRKPGEGEAENKKWGKVYMLKKKDEENEDEEELDESDDEFSRRGRQKQPIPIEIRFGDSLGKGRGKGFGRGRGRNVGSFEGSSNPTSKKSPSAPRVDNLDDFPSLSAT